MANSYRKIGTLFPLAMFVLTVAVQTNLAKTCDLSLEIFEQATGKPIKRAEGYAMIPGVKTTRIAKTENAGILKFDKLKVADYEFAIVKRGFKNSLFSLSVNCSDSIDQATGNLKVPLIEGKLGEIVYLRRGEKNSKSSSRPANIEDSKVLIGKAKKPVVPPYPEFARATRTTGSLAVRIVIDPYGRVVTAYPVKGHRYFREAAIEAAYDSIFEPTTLDKQPIEVTGIIFYNFRP